jgi:hypothetical protein
VLCALSALALAGYSAAGLLAQTQDNHRYHHHLHRCRMVTVDAAEADQTPITLEWHVANLQEEHHLGLTPTR